VNATETHVFFVDDEPALRVTVQRTLQSAGFRTAVFSCAEDCLAALSRHACDVVITDLRLEGMDGLALLQEIRHRFPWLQTIIVTAYGDVPSAVAAMRTGVVDFLEKPVDRRELLGAIEKARKVAAQPVPYPREALTEVEAQVLRLFLDGMTARKTAEILNRSSRTIEAHRHRLMRKFGVHNAAQLARKAGALWSQQPPAGA
jgi:two-component system response regulator FixJ